MEMRQMLCKVLSERMKRDGSIVILDADLAKALGTAPLHREFPDRCFNVGIAESNMISVAAGLASYGFTPVTCTFATFASRRVCDQIAQSIAFAKSNVKMLGGDPGVTAQINGATHMADEDIGVLRSIPDLVIFEPSDTTMMEKLLPEVLDYKGPVYIRLRRKDCPDIYGADSEMSLFRVEKLRHGSDVTLAASGIMVYHALEAADELASRGIQADVLDVHTVKPLDEQTVLESIARTGAVVSCENHNVIGGVGSAIAETAAKRHPVPMEFIGVQDHFGQAADQSYLMKKFKMTKDDIAEAAMRVIERKG